MFTRKFWRFWACHLSKELNLLVFEHGFNTASTSHSWPQHSQQQLPLLFHLPLHSYVGRWPAVKRTFKNRLLPQPPPTTYGPPTDHRPASHAWSLTWVNMTLTWPQDIFKRWLQRVALSPTWPILDGSWGRDMAPNMAWPYLSLVRQKLCFTGHFDCLWCGTWR